MAGLPAKKIGAMIVKPSVQKFVLDPAKSRNVLSLSGIWELQAGAKGTIPPAFHHTVQVPSFVDMATPPYRWADAEYHFYRKVFIINSAARSLTLFLRIDQAQYGTSVWLNGIQIGASLSCYTSQEYPIDFALKWDKENELIVRVGARNTLSPESAVGKDQEKEIFIPGMWGDVAIVATHNPAIRSVQVLPDIEHSTAAIRVTLENIAAEAINVEVGSRVLEKAAQKLAADDMTVTVQVSAGRTAQVTVTHPVTNAHLWSPDSPFLYEAETTVRSGAQTCDSVRTVFGMREFKIRGKGFFLNRGKILLRGGNIALHRFFSDKERGMLPWDRSWVKRALIDVPKSHNFNFFRNHLGHMPKLWYDIADEEGMLIQDEWQFWGRTGSKEQIRREFTEWLQDNWNHPSIVIWDPLNESSDEEVQSEIVPEMKKLDPTRPWESVDVLEEHPYIYSLGPVLNNRKFGFTRALEEVATSSKPTMLNEFVWWWLDGEGAPTSLMNGVVERWLGRSYTKEELFRHQAFLAQELVELFRRMRVDAIQPFVYLSNADGPTSHWFLGYIGDLNSKPILSALKNAFEPCGVSIELWDRHFFAGERRVVRIFAFNDTQKQKECRVRYGIVGGSGNWIHSRTFELAVPACESGIRDVEIDFPKEAGTYFVVAEISPNGESQTAVSKKIAHVFRRVDYSSLPYRQISVLDESNEIQKFLQSHTIPPLPFDSATLHAPGVLVVAGKSWRNREFTSKVRDVSEWVSQGGCLVLVEPEHNVESSLNGAVLEGLNLVVERRDDVDKGGYDSYVFAVDRSHPLWHGIAKEHLKMFNGAYGGEAVSEHNVALGTNPTVHAECGLGLSIPAVVEHAYGSGRVLLSRIQMRGRLVAQSSSHELYDRRADPVVQRHLVNMILYGANKTVGNEVRNVAVKP
ncbi:MAG: glycoside hydrolase family 2 TIM barrel-domain containing protein [Bacteroidota bacterium]